MRLSLGNPGARSAAASTRGSSEVGIVHLGLGAFHRAHQAAFTADAVAAEPGPWGICGVSRRRGALEALRAQDGLYGVLERGPEADSVA